MRGSDERSGLERIAARVGAAVQRSMAKGEGRVEGVRL